MELAAQELIPYHAGNLAQQRGVAFEDTAAVYPQIAQQLLDTPEWYLGQPDLWPITVGFSLCDVVRQGPFWTAAVTYTVQQQNPLDTSQYLCRFYTDEVEMTKDQGRWVVRRTHRHFFRELWPFADDLNQTLGQQLDAAQAPIPLPQKQGIPAVSGGVKVDLSTGCILELPREPFSSGNTHASPGWGAEIYGKAPLSLQKEVADHA